MKTYIISILSTILAFFAPIVFMFIITLYLVIFDMVFSIASKKYINRKRKREGLEPDLAIIITSNRFFKSTPKLILYYSSIILGILLDFAFGNIVVSVIGTTILYPFAYFALLIIVIRELMSIDENIRLVNDNKGFEYYFNYIFKIIDKIKKNIGKILK